MGIELWRVFNHLFQVVGEGLLLRSDVAFAIPESTRREVDRMCERRQRRGKPITYEYLRDALYKKGYRGDVRLEAITYWRHLKEREVALGDMYVWIARIEVFLHSFIQSVLEARYGDKWWREIPEGIRTKCATRLEEDFNPAEHAFAYTTLMDLRHTVDKKWSLFQSLVPTAVRGNKGRLLDGLRDLNTIRNRVMHPCKGAPITQDNFAFVHEFLAFLSIADWKRLARERP